MESFAAKIRLSPTFKGLNIPGSLQEARITQYADDTTLICTDIWSIRETLELCDYFGTTSGAKLNKEKTCAMWLGGWKFRTDQPFGIQWVTEKCMLGFIFTHGDVYKSNWQTILDKFQKTLDLHSKRNLSLHVKVRPVLLMLWPAVSYGTLLQFYIFLNIMWKGLIKLYSNLYGTASMNLLNELLLLVNQWKVV